jgi:hypothetical protein
MEVVTLVIIAACLGAGVAGGLLSSWACHRRLLVIEETFKLVVTSLEDRIEQLTKIAVRQDKSDAAKVRWSKKEHEEHALVKDLVTTTPSLHPWDPRTWGK